MKFRSSLPALLCLHAAQALLTPEKAISNDLVTSFDYFINSKIPAEPKIKACFSGLYPDVPMNAKLLTSDASFHGDTQQLLWGLYRK
jgi:hypothetical protein